MSTRLQIGIARAKRTQKEADAGEAIAMAIGGAAGRLFGAVVQGYYVGQAIAVCQDSVALGEAEDTPDEVPTLG